MMQQLRRQVFWMADSLKGSGVRRHYDEISGILEGIDQQHGQSPENILKSLIRHAVSTTGFYGDLSNDARLEQFPVVDKTLIRNQYDAFLSTVNSEEERIPAITSGSTGTPFKVYHDKNKKTRNTADTLYFANKTGYELGHRLVYLKIWAIEKMASPLHYKMQNMIPVDVIKLDDRQVQALIDEMESTSETFSILGYVSALETICKYLDRNSGEKLNTEVASIITMSESLTPYVKKKMEFYFGPEVFSRYSNLENGIIAQQVPGSNGRYLINRASYVVELLQMDSDDPVQIGEAGRIVVTDLYNFAMPMIRYDTGDIGILSLETDKYGNQYLEKVEGRKLDLLYDTSGEIVSSYIMYKNMWQYTEIKQYQLIQEGPKEYTFKINMDGDFDKEDQLASEFKKYLGTDADFKVEYVDEIPLLSSGKRKKTVNNWK